MGLNKKIVGKEAIEEIKSRHLSAEDEKKAIDEVNNQDLTEESIENELIEQLENNDKLYEDANTTTNKKTMKEKVGSIKKKVFTPENKKKWQAISKVFINIKLRNKL